MATSNPADEILVEKRAGTFSDPLVPISESKKIINNIVVLTELPSKTYHVVCSGYNETYDTPIASNQFLVNYTNKTVTFNISENGKTVDLSYYGAGYVSIPASMIYAHSDNPDVLWNLQEIIDNEASSISAINDLGSRISVIDGLIADGVVSSNNGKKIKVMTGVLRNSGSGWALIDDTGHTPVGITSVSVNVDNDIVINHDINASKVGTLLLDSDEVFSSYGIKAGASVGVDSSIIELYGDMQVSIDTSILTDVNQDFSSILGTMIQAKLSTDKITITHGNTSSLAFPIVRFTGATSHQITTRIARTTTQTTIECYKDYVGRWTLVDGVWTETYANFSTGAITATWVSGGLTLSHPAKKTITPSVIHGVGTNICTSYDTPPTSTTTRIRFLDSTHNYITTATNGMSVDVRIEGVGMIGSNALKTTIGTVNVCGLRHKLKASELFSSSGNIWVAGLMYFA